MRSLALTLALLFACDEGGDGGSRVSGVPPSGAPTTVATPSGSIQLPDMGSASSEEEPPPVEAAPSMTASVSVSSAPRAEGLLAGLSDSDEVKVTRLEGGADTLIDDDKKIEELLETIGLKQKAKDACPSGLVAITLTFKDKFGTRLATLSLFSDGDKLRPEAALRDGTGARCETIKLAHPDKLARLLK